MTLSDLASIGSFVSGIAVVFSFVFLALQMRQTARNQRAIIHNERAALVQELVLANFDGERVRIVARGFAGDQTLDPTESRQFLNGALATFRLLEEFFFQHRDGMLDEARWESNTLRVRGFLQSPGMRAAWRAHAGGFGPGFKGWIEAIMRETTVVTDGDRLVTVWKDFVKAELAPAQSETPPQRSGPGSDPAGVTS